MYVKIFGGALGAAENFKTCSKIVNSSSKNYVFLIYFANISPVELSAMHTSCYRNLYSWFALKHQKHQAPQDTSMEQKQFIDCIPGYKEA